MFLLNISNFKYSGTTATNNFFFVTNLFFLFKVCKRVCNLDLYYLCWLQMLHLLTHINMIIYLNSYIFVTLE